MQNTIELGQGYAAILRATLGNTVADVDFFYKGLLLTHGTGYPNRCLDVHGSGHAELRQLVQDHNRKILQKESRSAVDVEALVQEMIDNITTPLGRTTYMTTDGESFEDEEEALLHQAMLDLVERIRADGENATLMAKMAVALVESLQ